MPLKRKKRTQTLAGLKKRAWKLLSEVIRREAMDVPNGPYIRCYTCGYRNHWSGLQAGHAIGGRNGAVLLDEEIIRPQCVRCNIMLRGNYGEFVRRLIVEWAGGAPGYPNGLGHAMLWWEAKLQASRQVRKWDRAELEEKIEEYKARLEKLSPSPDR